MNRKRPGEGRQKGYVVSEESKQRARLSNPDRKIVTTPLGTFYGYHDAAVAHGVTKSMVKYMCQRGAQQREGKLLIHARTGEPLTDYTGYVSERTPHQKRRVRTPLGDFEYVARAAEAHGVTSASIIHAIKGGREGYSYLD